MNRNARLKLITAMLLAVILLLQIAPMGAESVTAGVRTVEIADRRISGDHLSADGISYCIEVTLDERESLEGEAELHVEELTEGAANYDDRLCAVSESMMLENVDQIRFVRLFDIIVFVDGKPFEPEYPAQVKITYSDAIELGDGQEVNIVHFADTGVEVIRAVDLSEDGKELTYKQSGFSVTATVVTTNNLQDGHQYILYARSGNKSYAMTHYSGGRDADIVYGVEINAGTQSGSTVNIDNYGSSIVWTAHKVTVNNSTYWTFSYEENGKTYYLRSYGGLMVGADSDINETGYTTPSRYQWSISNSRLRNLHSANNDNRYLSFSDNGQVFKERVSNSSSAFYFANVSNYTQDAPPTPKIHYVDEDGNELAVVNGRDWTTDSTTTPAYLIYDIDGYEYVKTTLQSIGGTEIRPILRKIGGKWQYTTSTEDSNSITWTNIPADNEEPDRQEDIYVVYKRAAEPVIGGTPKVKQVEGGEKPADPTISKSSIVNGDGTNTLSLSVSGHTAEMEVEKLADVIVIYDTSSSMRRHMGDSTNTYETNSTPVINYTDQDTRMWIAAKAVKSLANTLIGNDTEFINSNGEKLIQMSLISFNAKAEVKCDFTDDYTDFETAVDYLTTDTGTNWEAALDLANHLEVDPERATFVIFVTDGNPSYRMSRGNLLTLDGYPETVNDANLDIRTNNEYYSYRGLLYFGPLNETEPRNYNTAAVTAQSIVSHNKNFYSIGIGNSAGITRLQGLTAAAYNNPAIGRDHTKTADSQEELAQAFEEITASIVALMGHSDIQIMDGIADLTQTVQKSSLVSFADDDFTYYKGHAATAQDVANGLASAEGETVWVSWDPASEGCAEAVYNTETGAVEWNMGPGFMLEEGYTYQVRFKVWPSQEAYDLLADLNNGVKSYDSLTDEEKAQIQEPTTEGGMYTLKTNGETSYTYREATKTGDTVTPTGEPSEPGSFPDVDPLELTTKPLKVMKQWHNNYVDSRLPTDSITLELYGVDPDGVTSHSFKEFQLTKDGGWYAENNYISYGLVTYDTATDAGEKIYEAGHDFTLRETDDEAHYYELTAGVYRPMFINGTPTILEQVDSAPAGMSDSVFHYSDGSHHYYRLDGKIYRDTQSDILMIATNTHRSYMDLNKAVVDESGNSVLNDEEFEYHITFTVPEDIDNYDTVEKYIWFNVYDTVAGRTLSPSEYSYTNAQLGSEFSGPAYANYLVATSGQQLTLKIKQGWNVRFLNLPNGTTYSFEETGIPTGYNFVKAEVSGTRWIANMVDGIDQSTSPQDIPSLPSNNSGNNDNTAINGSIDYANARYNTTYTNKTSPKAVKVLKTKRDGAAVPLPGAVFSLYTQSGYAADPKQAAAAGLTSDEKGMFDLGLLACGTYYLEETSVPYGYSRLSGPVVINVTETGVACGIPFTVSGNDGDGYIVAVPNAPLTAKLPLQIVKILEGRDMEEGEFSFVLQPIKTNGTLDGRPLQTIYNPEGLANQEVTISFSPLEFSGDSLADAPYYDADGNAVYYYVVYEEHGNAGGMTYSDSRHIVKVTLIQEGNKLFAVPQFYPYSGEGSLPAEATVNVTAN